MRTITLSFVVSFFVLFLAGNIAYGDPPANPNGTYDFIQYDGQGNPYTIGEIEFFSEFQTLCLTIQGQDWFGDWYRDEGPPLSWPWRITDPPGGNGVLKAGENGKFGVYDPTGTTKIGELVPKT